MVSSEATRFRCTNIIRRQLLNLDSDVNVLNLYLYTCFILIVLLYKLMSVSPRINLYLYGGNYGEDRISNHIVGCYLFPERCRIRH